MRAATADIGSTAPLRYDALQAQLQLVGGADQVRAVVVVGRTQQPRQPGSDGLVEVQSLELRPALLPRQAAGVLSVEDQHVEGDLCGGRRRSYLLHRRGSVPRRARRERRKFVRASSPSTTSSQSRTTSRTSSAAKAASRASGKAAASKLRPRPRTTCTSTHRTHRTHRTLFLPLLPRWWSSRRVSSTCCFGSGPGGGSEGAREVVCHGRWQVRRPARAFRDIAGRWLPRSSVKTLMLGGGADLRRNERLRSPEADDLSVRPEEIV